MTQAGPSLVVATGADERFGRALDRLLTSLPRAGPVVREVRVYDLGLHQDTRARLAADHPTARFLSFPEGVAPEVHTFGWKPRLIGELAEAVGAPFLWLDAATVVMGSLEPVTDQLAAAGLWSPMAGGGPVRAHPTSRAYLDQAGISPAWKTQRSRAAGICAFDPRVPEVQELLRRWQELAEVEECLAPPGSHPRNHNFDQTILTALLYEGEAEGRWDLGIDALAISSDQAIDFLMERAKVPAWVPRRLDRLAVRLLWVRRTLDVLIWRLRWRGRTPEPAARRSRPTR